MSLFIECAKIDLNLWLVRGHSPIKVVSLYPSDPLLHGIWTEKCFVRNIMLGNTHLTVAYLCCGLVQVTTCKGGAEPGYVRIAFNYLVSLIRFTCTPLNFFACSYSF